MFNSRQDSILPKREFIGYSLKNYRDDTTGALTALFLPYAPVPYTPLVTALAYSCEAITKTEALTAIRKFYSPDNNVSMVAHPSTPNVPATWADVIGCGVIFPEVAREIRPTYCPLIHAFRLSAGETLTDWEVNTIVAEFNRSAWEVEFGAARAIVLFHVARLVREKGLTTPALTAAVENWWIGHSAGGFDSGPGSTYPYLLDRFFGTVIPDAAAPHPLVYQAIERGITL